MATCKCPHCGGEVNPVSLLASVTSEAKATAARENGKRGGRPKKVQPIKYTCRQCEWSGLENETIDHFCPICGTATSYYD